MPKLKVSWYNDTTGAVDEALNYLPEGDLCPTDLYRSLLSIKTSESMRIVVVSDDGQPIAVSAMVRRGRFVWEPLTNWLFPGNPFPFAEGRNIEALSALDRQVPLAWWRMNNLPSTDHRITNIEIKPTYRMTDIARREEFWKSTDYLRHIKNIRNRTQRLEVRVGATEFAKQIVGGWHRKWIDGNDASSAIAYRVRLAEALEPVGKHITVALLDDGKLIAGSTNFVHQGALVAGVSYLDPEYRKLGAGVRMIDTVFDVAEQRGLLAFDLGAGADYKAKWAPQSGSRAKFTISHWHIDWLGRCERLQQRIARRLTLPMTGLASNMERPELLVSDVSDRLGAEPLLRLLA